MFQMYILCMTQTGLNILLHTCTVYKREDVFLDDELEAEVKRLRNESTCKICKVTEHCIVFLPCSHLVCCDNCARLTDTCPICSENICETVRVFPLDMYTCSDDMQRSPLLVLYCIHTARIQQHFSNFQTLCSSIISF